jgi:hypothetical protein
MSINLYLNVSKYNLSTGTDVCELCVVVLCW